MTTTSATTSATDASSAAAIAAAAAQANSTASTAFKNALTSGIVEARTISTTSLGSMVSGALNATRSLAISRPTTTSGSSTAGLTNSLAASGSTASSSTAKTGKLQIPEELKVYGNGKIPAEALEKIGIKGHKLWGPAAEAFKQLRAAAAADGIDVGITDSYRPYEEQVDLVRRKGLYSQGGLAAKPGTSPHGWGMALDVDVTKEGLAWLREHGAEYGWVECVPREPWHWEYRP